MKKITVMIGLSLALLVPAVSLAKPTPNAGDKRAAKAECKTLRGTTSATREAFLTKFRNFGACVSKKSKEEAQEAQNAHTNAARECKMQRSEDSAAFATEWGTNGNDKNAFGKCVSTTAKAKEHNADAKDKQDATEFKNAAESCASERAADPTAFRTTFGAGRKNAFGKCVSQKAHEASESVQRGS